MNVNNKLPYEAPVADAFQLSAAPLNICIQFSGEAGFTRELDTDIERSCGQLEGISHGGFVGELVVYVHTLVL